MTMLFYLGRELPPPPLLRGVEPLLLLPGLAGAGDGVQVSFLFCCWFCWGCELSVRVWFLLTRVRSGSCVPGEDSLTRPLLCWFVAGAVGSTAPVGFCARFEILVLLPR